MQILVKKSVEKGSINSISQKNPKKNFNNKKKFLKSASSKRSKFKKKNRFLKPISNSSFRRAFRQKRIGRGFSRFKSFIRQKFFNLTVRVAYNNMFITLRDSKSNLLLKNVSAGNYKINISKKGLRFQAKEVFNLFLKDIRGLKIPMNRSVVTKVIAPITVRRILLKDLSKLFLKKFKKKKSFIVAIDPKKIYNGCKARKMVKKKRKTHILYR